MASVFTRLQRVGFCLEVVRPEWIVFQDMAVDSALEPLTPPESAEGLVEGFLHRVQNPWRLGGAIVVAVFILGTLSLVIFALVYGCCCNNSNLNASRLKKKKTSGNEVI